MGWLFMDSLGTFASPKAYMDAQFNFSNGDGTSEVLASAVIKGRNWYAACKQTKASGETQIFALVCLIRYNPRSKDGHVFGYKDMSEFMGPCESECPARILDLLTPTTEQYALDWRARCRAALDAIALRKRRPAAKPGDTVIFTAAIMFTDGSEGKRFVLQQQGGKEFFTNPVNSKSYRIPGWKNRAWTSIPKIDRTIDMCRSAA